MILLDVLKGFVPAFLGVQLVSPLCGIVAGAAAMAGHYRPLFLGFQKGGKMVATAGGVFFGVAPLVALGAAVVWLVAFGAHALHVGRVDRWRRCRCRSWLLLFGYPTAVIVLGCVERGRRRSSCTARTCAGCARGPRTGSRCGCARAAHAVAVWPPPEFSRLVTLACHDLRTPLATVNGFAKTLAAGGRARRARTRFVGLIDAAGEQMNELLDLLGLAARIESGRYEPALREVDTLELVARRRRARRGRRPRRDGRDRRAAVRRALGALASAALRHGGVERVTWTVEAAS